MERKVFNQVSLSEAREELNNYFDLEPIVVYRKLKKSNYPGLDHPKLLYAEYLFSKFSKEDFSNSDEEKILPLILPLIKYRNKYENRLSYALKRKFCEVMLNDIYLQKLLLKKVLCVELYFVYKIRLPNKY